MNEGVGGSTGPIEAYEVDADGSVIWHLIVRGTVQLMFRATSLSTVAGEHEVQRDGEARPRAPPA
jgi:hypothetical protein